MNRSILFELCLACVTGAYLSAHAYGHGTPIRVDVANSRLVVSQGLADADGFAPMIFAESDDAGDPFGTLDLPGFGPATLWQIPGYEIFGLAENSGFTLVPFARPVKGAEPVENRVLWYWNPETELVERAPASTMLQIRKTPSLFTTLSAASAAAPPPLQLAAPVAADMGFHNHLVLYAINESTPAGAYGFFARLTSNLYAASEPFLIVLNNGLFDYQQMAPAALAINAAAANANPGDFNGDGIVDSADYTVWCDGLGNGFTLDQYSEWKSHFGVIYSGSAGIAQGPATVPEPNLFTLAASGFFCIVVSQRARRLRQSARGAGSIGPNQFDSDCTSF